jgi:predicted transcriptional regulator
MNVERKSFGGQEPPESDEAWDARIAALAEAAMKDPKYRAVFGPEHEAESLAQARADIAAGRVYSNEEVIAWLKTWGKPDAKPFPHRWSR